MGGEAAVKDTVVRWINLLLLTMIFAACSPSTPDCVSSPSRESVTAKVEYSRPMVPTPKVAASDTVPADPMQSRNPSQ